MRTGIYQIRDSLPSSRFGDQAENHRPTRKWKTAQTSLKTTPTLLCPRGEERSRSYFSPLQAGFRAQSGTHRSPFYSTKRKARCICTQQVQQQPGLGVSLLPQAQTVIWPSSHEKAGCGLSSQEERTAKLHQGDRRILSSYKMLIFCHCYFLHQFLFFKFH